MSDGEHPFKRGIKDPLFCRSEVWYVVSGFSAQSISRLKLRSHSVSVLFWNLWGKQNKPSCKLIFCLQSSAHGCRTEVTVNLLAVFKCSFQLLDATCIPCHMATSIFKSTTVHQIILMLQNHWLLLIPPAREKPQPLFFRVHVSQAHLAISLS